ncbi:MAG: DUF58 domain-containing protein [Clostridia bacterium]|nr:DUF58 domain-containing protein [Clostridia bacterium]
MNVLILLSVLLTLYALQAVLIRHIGLRHLTCTRAFSKPAYFEGEEGELIEIVRNDRAMIIPWLRVESGVSPYIRFGRQENLHISDTAHTCSLFTLMPYQQIKRRHRVAFLRRGAYNLGSASLTAGDLLGLMERHREQEMDVPVLVYPRLIDSSAMPQPLTRLLSETVSRRQLLCDPFLFRGIRPYLPGDPVRDIHWSATARTGETQIRLHDPSAKAQLLVVLNMERTSAQWGERLMDYEQEEIEYEISMAATLCMQALDMGQCAGFCANMPIGDSRESAFVPPAGGAPAREALLAAFAQLRLVRTLSFPTFLGRLEAHRDLDMIILSCYDSEEIQSAMHRLRQNGSQVSLYLVREGRIAS